MYRAMGSLGWDRSEVKQRDIWEVARDLGEGKDDALPTMRGARWINHPSDDDDEPEEPPGPGRKSRPRKRRVGKGAGKSPTDKAIARAKVHQARQAERQKPDGATGG